MQSSERRRRIVISTAERRFAHVVAMATPATPRWKHITVTRLSTILRSPDTTRIINGFFVSPAALTIPEIEVVGHLEGHSGKANAHIH